MTIIAEIFQRFIGKRKVKNSIEGGTMPNFDDYIYNDQKAQDVIETVILKEKEISFGALAEEYRILWDTLNVRQSRITEIDNIVDKIQDKQVTYQSVANATQIPWYVIAVVHYLESSLDFTTHLHNGDPLTGYTVNYPEGRLKSHQPPFTWEESAIDALTYDGLNALSDWSIEKIAYHLEAFNGFGYRRHHPNVKSPYLWSFSNHYEKGRYIGDRHWSEDSISDQCGAMVLICQMIARGIIVAPPMDGDAPFANVAQLVTETKHDQENDLSSTDEQTLSDADQGTGQPAEEAITDPENPIIDVSTETVESDAIVPVEAADTPIESESEQAQQVEDSDGDIDSPEVAPETPTMNQLLADNTNIEPQSVTETATSDNNASVDDLETAGSEAIEQQQQISDTLVEPVENEESAEVSDQSDNSLDTDGSPSLNTDETSDDDANENSVEDQQEDSDSATANVDDVSLDNPIVESVATDSVSEQVEENEHPVASQSDEKPDHEAQFIETEIEQIPSTLESTDSMEPVVSVTLDVSTPAWLETARGELGIRDFPGPFYEPRVFTYMQTTLQNPNNDETSWSSAFVNWCMVQSGHSGTNDTNARNWLNYGDVLNEPKPGCIAVLWKGSSQSHNGHVGFFDGFEGNRVRILGAHSGGGVEWEEAYVASYPTERILGYRWPRDNQSELEQVPENRDADLITQTDH